MSPYQQGIAAEANAVLLIGRGFFLPKNLGHNAEHGTAIEAKGAAIEIMDFEFPEMHDYEVLAEAGAWRDSGRSQPSARLRMRLP